MNNQFSQRVSDIIVYSKEEANRLRSRYIGPEHLLLGMLRDGEGVFLDDVTIDEVESALNINVIPVRQDGNDLFIAITGNYSKRDLAYLKA